MILLLLENMQDKISITPEIEELINKSLDLSLQKEGFIIPSEISVTLLDNAGIRRVNREFRDIDLPTDVLSFPLVEMVEGKIISNIGDFDLNEQRILLGDILVSVERVAEQAQEYQHSFERELAFLITHGAYHLLGYDHIDERSETLMLGKQNAVLNEMGLKRFDV